MSAITEDRIREIIKEVVREELQNLSISVDSSTESIDGEYIKFLTGVCLSLKDEVISCADGW